MWLRRGIKLRDSIYHVFQRWWAFFGVRVISPRSFIKSEKEFPVEKRCSIKIPQAIMQDLCLRSFVKSKKKPPSPKRIFVKNTPGHHLHPRNNNLHPDSRPNTQQTTKTQPTPKIPHSSNHTSTQSPSCRQLPQTITYPVPRTREGFLFRSESPLLAPDSRIYCLSFLQ